MACPEPSDTDAMLAVLDRALRETGCARPGEPAILVASTPFARAHTNLLKLHRVTG
jgi:pyruvate kinase